MLLGVSLPVMTRRLMGFLDKSKLSGPRDGSSVVLSRPAEIEVYLNGSRVGCWEKKESERELQCLPDAAREGGGNTNLSC